MQNKADAASVSATASTPVRCRWHEILTFRSLSHVSIASFLLVFFCKCVVKYLISSSYSYCICVGYKIINLIFSASWCIPLIVLRHSDLYLPLRYQVIALSSRTSGRASLCYQSKKIIILSNSFLQVRIEPTAAVFTVTYLCPCAMTVSN